MVGVNMFARERFHSEVVADRTQETRLRHVPEDGLVLLVDAELRDDQLLEPIAALEEAARSPRLVMRASHFPVWPIILDVFGEGGIPVARKT
jgi:hypothetical protein